MAIWRSRRRAITVVTRHRTFVERGGSAFITGRADAVRGWREMEKMTISEAADRGYAPYLDLLLAVKDGLVGSEKGPKGETLVSTSDILRVFPANTMTPVSARREHFGGLCVEEDRRGGRDDMSGDFIDSPPPQQEGGNDRDAYRAAESTVLRAEIENKRTEIIDLLARLQKAQEDAKKEFARLSAENSSRRREVAAKQDELSVLSQKREAEQADARREHQRLNAALDARQAEISVLTERAASLDNMIVAERVEAKAERARLYELIESIAKLGGETRGKTWAGERPGDTIPRKESRLERDIAAAMAFVIIGWLLGTAAYYLWSGHVPMLELWHQR